MLLRDNRREVRGELGGEVYVGGVLFTALVVLLHDGFLYIYILFLSSHSCSTMIDGSFTRELGAG